ncbi:hypothetical protein JTB14_022674 [Gonioctena quinquepunctata]|nr:hypothetical protein JTB14_022674 [Gonioctena quinquepunctata]
MVLEFFVASVLFFGRASRKAYLYAILTPFRSRKGRTSIEEMMVGSPNSTQSDSDNSVSSVEIPQKELRMVSNIIKFAEKSEVQCCWKSCGIFYSSLDQLAAHISQVHSASGLGGLFYCGWEGCSRNNKSFNARYKMLVHGGKPENPHQIAQRRETLRCTVPGCNKAYSNSSDRFKHTRTHQVEKPYQCKVPGCPKRYTDPSSLRKHTKTYKHFVNENQKMATDENVKMAEETRDKGIDEIQPLSRENVIRHPCGCNRGCSVINCQSHADFFKIEALINLRNEERSLNTWNRYIEPYFADRPVEFAQYEENIQIDVPLDLSLHRKTF